MIEVASKDSHRALIALCGLMGCRVAEALAMRPSNFDLERMQATIRGKGGRVRVVPISSYAWEVLQTPTARAFCSGDLEIVGLKDRFARRVITQLAEKANLKRHVASHDLRATFATSVYDKTLDQRLVQELLGHASGSTTEIYIGRSNDQLRKGVELI